MPEISKIRARFIGSDNQDFRHFHIYDLFTFIVDSMIAVKSTEQTANYIYKDVAAFAKDWQIVYNGDESQKGSDADSN